MSERIKTPPITCPTCRGEKWLAGASSLGGAKRCHTCRGKGTVTAPILDAVTAKVLSYRPVDKGLAAKKTARKLKRKAKADD